MKSEESSQTTLAMRTGDGTGAECLPREQTTSLGKALTYLGHGGILVLVVALAVAQVGGPSRLARAEEKRGARSQLYLEFYGKWFSPPLGIPIPSVAYSRRLYSSFTLGIAVGVVPDERVARTYASVFAGYGLFKHGVHSLQVEFGSSWQAQGAAFEEDSCLPERATQHLVTVFGGLWYRLETPVFLRVGLVPHVPVWEKGCVRDETLSPLLWGGLDVGLEF